jgi:uncharacterized membrane protein YfcA
VDFLLIFVVVFFSAFTQSLTGFGVALISMPILSAALGVQTAAPLVAVFALATEIVLVVYYRSALDLRVVWKLVVASIVGVPVGVLALRVVDEQVVLALLGLIVGGYALYALLNLRLPSIEGAGWAYGAGFLSGMLGGAYNTTGPPVIVYGDCRRWSPAAFKANLQGFFVLTSIVILASHLAAGNITPPVLQGLLAALPALGLGIVTGLGLSSRLNSSTFRKIVLWFLLVLGLSLIVSQLF